MLSASLLVVHDTSRGGEHNVAERTSRKHLGHPALDVAERHAEARRDHTALVDAAVEVHDNLAGAVVVDDLKVTDVACECQRMSGAQWAGWQRTPSGNAM